MIGLLTLLQSVSKIGREASCPVEELLQLAARYENGRTVLLVPLVQEVSEKFE